MPGLGRRSVGLRFIAAQFVPMVVLGLAYLSAQHDINRVYLAGISLDRLLLTSAVIAPLLSQSVSGPLFRSLEVMPSREFRETAELTLRNLPRAMLLAAPVLGAVCTGTAAVLGLDARGVAALTAVAWLHLLFAATLVPAYAHRRGELLVVGWSTYAAALALLTWTWWAPSLLAAGSQLVVLAAASRRPAREVPLAGLGSMLAGMTRGMALALPLWCLPLGVYLGSEGTLSPFAIFVALVPAVLAYQVYFVLVATPVWLRLDRARELLAAQPYVKARAELDAIGLQVRRGVRRTTGLVGVLLLAVSAILAVVPRHDQVPLFVELTFSACLSVLVIAQLTRLVMVREGATPYVVSLMICVPVMVASAGTMGTAATLAVHAASCLVCLAGLTAANRVVWRTPEYSLFWARALHA